MSEALCRKSKTFLPSSHLALSLSQTAQWNTAVHCFRPGGPKCGPPKPGSTLLFRSDGGFLLLATFPAVFWCAESGYVHGSICEGMVLLQTLCECPGYAILHFVTVKLVGNKRWPAGTVTRWSLTIFEISLGTPAPDRRSRKCSDLQNFFLRVIKLKKQLNFRQSIPLRRTHCVNICHLRR